jgi:hypothetical protein
MTHNPILCPETQKSFIEKSVQFMYSYIFRNCKYVRPVTGRNVHDFIVTSQSCMALF